MVSKAKLYIQLDRLEDELKERLVAHLERAIIGENNSVFCAADFQSHSNLKNLANLETDQLVQLGRQILVLREKLCESSVDSIAESLCLYCRRWARAGDKSCSLTQQLAREFLDEIVSENGK